MQRVLILGSGGHGQVVADILRAARSAGAPREPIGFLDDDVALQGSTRLALPVLGTTNDVARVPHDALIIAIGDNLRRKQLFDQLSRLGEQFAVAQHPAAVVAPQVVLGQGVVIAAGVIVNPGSLVGHNVILNTACLIEHHNRIADHVHIAPGARLGGDVEIGEGTLVGLGATVMPQRKVGRWAIIGAAALVHDAVPDYAVAVGVPARTIRTMSER